MTAPKQTAHKRQTKKKPGPKKVTPKYLENAALHYLGRYSASAAGLHRVLMRKVERSAHAHDTDASEGAQWVDDLITRYIHTGLIDDLAYARAKTISLRRRGTSARMIRGKLNQAGVEAAIIDRALAEHAEDHENADLAAAIALARRRRLGPYRDEAARAERRQKDLSSLARAGFTFDLVKTVVDAHTVEELEDMEDGRES